MPSQIKLKFSHYPSFCRNFQRFQMKHQGISSGKGLCNILLTRIIGLDKMWIITPITFIVNELKLQRNTLFYWKIPEIVKNLNYPLKII